MKNIALLLSLMTLALTMSACTKGCKANQAGTPPTEENAKQNDDNDKGDAKEPEAKNDKAEGNEKELLMTELKLHPGEKLYAIINTNMGEIKAELFWDKAPATVWNFASLALGKKEWTNPTTGTKETKPLYDGTIFHRVIKGFMIQGGDPAGNGMGGPGYRFKDEFHPELKHDKKGILSMANSGPNTNGSQFFITEGPTPHLDNRHSVFGQVQDEASLEIISKIAGVATAASDRPQTDIIIKDIKIKNGDTEIPRG